MNKLMGLLVLVVAVAITTGCAAASKGSVWKMNAGSHVSAHDWKNPGCKADFSSNPMTSECTVGIFTIGSQMGWSNHPDGKWASFDAELGELEADDS